MECHDRKLYFLVLCRYVKYLYPYECETVKLSDPQELQMAIDSNKRDRRHSENMDFMAPQLQREMDPILSPVVSSTPQGLQLISSPTMALPHTSLPPYSGGFIVAGGPGGTHQLVQMTPHMPGIPIVMPTPATIPVSTHSQQATPLSNHSQTSEDREDAQSHSSGESMAPPAKRPALEPSHVKLGGGTTNRAGYSIHHTSTGNIIMTHGGVASAGAPQLIQMNPHGQIPIVLPTGQVSTVREQKCPTPQHIQLNGKTESSITKSEAGGGITVTALPHSHSAGAMLSQQQRGSLPPSHPPRNLLQMAQHPGLIIPQPLPPTPHTAQSANGEERRKTEQEKNGATAQPHPPTTNAGPVKMPFANISIQPGKRACVSWRA